MVANGSSFHGASLANLEAALISTIGVFGNSSAVKHGARKEGQARAFITFEKNQSKYSQL